jgi:PAS domain S-box-containing protein
VQVLAPPADAGHVVQFYETDDHLADVVSGFLADGLLAGEGAIAIASAAHRAGFTRGLRARGVDVEAVTASGRLQLLDAEQTLQRFLVDGAPDPVRFRAVLDAVMDTARGADGSRAVRAFGEMVDVLWTRGSQDAALRLEQLWSDARRERPFALLCSYVLSSFYRDAAAMRPVCAAHESVAPIPMPASMLGDFVDNANVALHCVGPDGTILWANRAELELMGYTAAEYIGQNVADFYVDADDAAEVMRTLHEHGQLREHEVRVRTKSGEIRHLLIDSSVHRAGDEFVHTRCISRDITMRRRAEDARDASFRRTQQLLRVTAAIANAVTPEQVHEAIVDRVAAAVGATSAVLFSRERDRVRVVRKIGTTVVALERFPHLTIADAGKLPGIDAIARGEMIWIESREDLLARYPAMATELESGREYRGVCLPIFDDGQPFAALRLLFDATPGLDDWDRDFLHLVARYSGQALERIRLLEAERASRERAEILYGLAREVIVAERIEQVYEAALDAIHRGLGNTRAAILTYDADPVMHFRAWRGLSDDYRAAVDGHSPWPRGTRDARPVLVPDVAADASLDALRPVLDRERIASCAFIPLLSGAALLGKFMLYDDHPRTLAHAELDLARAIADHVAIALARFTAIDELRETVRFNELFTGVLGHDLRNPLGAIMTAAQLALSRGTSDKVAKPLSRILSSSARMGRMIEQLLDFTRVRMGGGLPMTPSPMDLSSVVRQAIDELEDANPEWTLTFEHTGGTVGTWDADRLAQVFSNLVANAVQHGDPAGGVRVRVDGSFADRVRIDVHNLGAIPASELPNLFEPLTGGRRSRAGSRGLGLGLYITREIVRSHGGTIAVTSSEADGTRFVVDLPRTS